MQINYNLSNSFLRIFSLICRSVLILSVSYFLSVDDVAAFGVLLALSTFTIFLVGGDFYTFTTRRIESYKESGYTLLKTQFVMQSSLGFIIAPSLVFLLLQLQYPIKVVLIMLVYTCFEFVNVEFTKYLTAKGRHSQVTLGLLLRNSITASSAFILLLFSPESRELEFVLLVLLSGSGICSLLFLSGSRHQFTYFFAADASLSLAKKMVVSSIVLLGSSLSMRAILTFDKVMYDISSVSTLVASYVVFASLGQAVVSIVEATILSYSLPRVIKLGNDSNILELRKSIKTLYVKVTLMLGGVALLFWICLPVLLDLYPNKSYLNNIDMFWIVFSAYAVFVVGLVANQGLYSLKKDIFGLKVGLIGLLILIASWWLLYILNIVFFHALCNILIFFSYVSCKGG